jgi:hypothetical protein
LAFKTARGRAAPVGREEMDVRSVRVSSTHAGMGRWSRRSEISSRGEVEYWVGTTSSRVGGLAATVLTLAFAFFLVFPAAGLVAALDFGLGFLDPAVFLVAVTIGCEGASVTGLGGLGLGGGVVVALTTRPPRTTWFQPSPRSVCSADGPARWALGAVEWLVAALFRTPSGARFARAALASFHFTHPL